MQEVVVRNGIEKEKEMRKKNEGGKNDTKKIDTHTVHKNGAWEVVDEVVEVDMSDICLTTNRTCGKSRGTIVT